MRIFQGYYDEASKKQLDPAAEPMDIGFNFNHPLYEYNIFKKMQAEGLMTQGPVGLLSWKFRQKTLIGVEEFAKFCEKALASGADVAFINPMIAAEAMYISVWEQAIHVMHNGIKEIYHALFTKEEIDRIQIMPRTAFAFCNYFVATPAFWARYFAYCDGMLARIEALKDTNPDIYQRIYGSANYHRDLKVDFRPFIIERFFSNFLLLNPDIVRVNFEWKRPHYDAKFGEQNGQYLLLLSDLKNNAILAGRQEFFDKWNQARQIVLTAALQLWEQDDPQPLVTTNFTRDLTGAGMTIKLDDIQPALDEMVGRGDANKLFTTISKLAFQLCQYQPLNGQALFIPQLDDRLKTAAQRFIPAPADFKAGRIIVHVATEVYETGGHSRVLEDIVRALPEYRHMLILTDVTENYRSGRIALGLLKPRFDAIGLEVTLLEEDTLPRKSHELAEHIARLMPQAVFLLGHHYDVVANAGVSGNSAPRVIYLHHCDHNPALGPTRTDFLHVDISPAAYDACKTMPGLAPEFLEMSVEDKGVVMPSNGDALIGATCATAYKYVGRYSFSYAELLAALFAGGLTKMMHIGTMPPAQGEEIKRGIRALGQDPERLIFIPNIPNLADGLKEIKPDFFLCSYPLGGGKAVIEAMSVGLPLLFPRCATMPSIVCVDMSFGTALKIGSPGEAAGALANLRAEKEQLGRTSRKTFERYYSESAFRSKLLGLIADKP